MVYFSTVLDILVYILDFVWDSEFENIWDSMRLLSTETGGFTESEGECVTDVTERVWWTEC